MTEKRKEHRFYAAFFITRVFFSDRQGPVEAGRGQKKALDNIFFWQIDDF
jgi:hypothetical protein